MEKYTKEELYKMDAVDVYKMVLKGDIIKKFPNGFWQQPEAKQNAAKCSRYLIEEILKYDDELLKEKSSISLFNRNKLRGMLSICFNNSPYKAINNAYDGKFKEWEFKSVPNKYWDDRNNGIKATKWLIEEKLKLSDEEIKEQLSADLFRKNKLISMIQTCFNSSPYEAVNSVYPGKYKEWEFKSVPMGFWDDRNNGIKATKWLIEEKLKLSDDELKNNLSQNLFAENGLLGMIQMCFNSSPYEAVNSVYPGKYKEWEFKFVPMGFWDDKDNGIKATRWLIEDKLKLSDDELKEKLSVGLFKDNGLGGMLLYCFDGSPYQAINRVYPNKYKEWEFKSTPMGFWDDKDNGIKAIRWMVEEKLKLNDEQLKEQLSQKLFRDNGLYGMLVHCFDNSLYDAINYAYPNRFKKTDFKGYN